LIDVLLVLIIVFMVVVIEQRSTGLRAEIPQQPNPTGSPIPPPQRTIVIQIRHAKPGAEHPQVMVNEEAVEWNHLRERPRDIFAIHDSRAQASRAFNGCRMPCKNRRMQRHLSTFARNLATFRWRRPQMCRSES
jgi:hypothetical protein